MEAIFTALQRFPFLEGPNLEISRIFSNSRTAARLSRNQEKTNFLPLIYAD
jgi:hypothetical protein